MLSLAHRECCDDIVTFLLCLLSILLPPPSSYYLRSLHHFLTPVLFLCVFVLFIGISELHSSAGSPLLFSYFSFSPLLPFHFDHLFALYSHSTLGRFLSISFVFHVLSSLTSFLEPLSPPLTSPPYTHTSLLLALLHLGNLKRRRQAT